MKSGRESIERSVIDDTAYSAPLDEELFIGARVDRGISDGEALAVATLPPVYSPLEHERVLELARIVQYSDDPLEVEEATETLVRHNTKLAFWGAQRAHFERVYMPFTDIVQAALIGVYRAARKFDPDRGLRFGNYAPYWMQTTIRRETARYVRVPRQIFDKFPSTHNTALRLRDEFGRMPSAIDLADAMGAAPQSIVEQMMYRQRILSDRRLTLSASAYEGRRTETGMDNIDIGRSTDATSSVEANSNLAQALCQLDKDLDEVGSACLEQILEGRKDLADLMNRFDFRDQRAVIARYERVQSLLRHPFYAVLAVVDPAYTWQRDALCRLKGDASLVSQRFQGQLRAARDVCGSCAVRGQCLQLATEGARPVTAGIWAGMRSGSLQ